MSSPPSSWTARFDGRLDRFGLTHVGDQGKTAPAGGRGDLLRRGRHVFVLAAHDRHVRPMPGQGLGNATADARAAPRDQGDLPREQVVSKNTHIQLASCRMFAGRSAAESRRRAWQLVIGSAFLAQHDDSTVIRCVRSSSELRYLATADPIHVGRIANPVRAMGVGVGARSVIGKVESVSSSPYCMPTPRLELVAARIEHLDAELEGPDQFKHAARGRGTLKLAAG